MTKSIEDRTFGALRVYEQELAAWTLLAIESSRYIDKGVLRYKHYWAHDMKRQAGPDHVYSRVDVSEEYGPTFLKLQAMQKVVELLNA